MRYAIELSYDGTAYCGWQRQKNAVSVQEKLEESFFLALGKKVSVTASGRTDAGVHAAKQVCHFDLDCTVPTEKIPDCVNRFLPNDIRVLKGFVPSDGFDANRFAKRKTYCYRLYESKREMPLKERFAVRVETLPSLEKLRAAAAQMEGEHDFKAFCASGSSVKTTVRTVYSVRVEEHTRYGGREAEIFVTGNGFLYNMVRTMVGELLDLANDRRGSEDLRRAFATGDRSLVGKTMPAKGLTLENVEYDELR